MEAIDLLLCMITDGVSIKLLSSDDSYGPLSSSNSGNSGEFDPGACWSWCKFLSQLTWDSLVWLSASFVSWDTLGESEVTTSSCMDMTGFLRASPSNTFEAVNCFLCIVTDGVSTKLLSFANSDGLGSVRVSTDMVETMDCKDALRSFDAVRDPAEMTTFSLLLVEEKDFLRCRKLRPRDMSWRGAVIRVCIGTLTTSAATSSSDPAPPPDSRGTEVVCSSKSDPAGIATGSHDDCHLLSRDTNLRVFDSRDLEFMTLHI
mmetsp:Transcript_47626/g.92982  ORF Transcript_47626/g.92982 Transcript_47626/m.92982 type:complete len:260 (+) Transcript_47626:2163-2942(+)